MKNAKKKKALLLTAVSSMTLAAATVAVMFGAGKGKYSGITAGSRAPGSVLFSRSSGNFRKVSDTEASISGTTGNGATYYAYCRSISDVSDTNYIAQFGFGKAYDEQYITFSTRATDDSDFEFQSITGIKVTTSSAPDQTLYVYYSSDGVNFNNSYAVTANSSPEKVVLGAAQKFVRLGTATTQSRNIVSIELFYDCGEGSDPEPEPKEVSYLSFGSMKSSYVLGDEFEEPEVIAHYTDSTSETVSASFSAVNMSQVGKQSVTASYGGVEKSFTIEIRPTAASREVSYMGLYLGDYDEHQSSEFLKTESDLPIYGEPGETFTFTPVFKDAFMYCDAYEIDDKVVTFTFDGTDVSFTMPNSAIVIYLVYQDNPYKTITFTGVDVSTFDYVESSSILAQAVPNKAEPGDTVQFQLVGKTGISILGVDGEDSGITITESSGTYSFTMPSSAVEIFVYFQEVPELVSISVVSPKTSYEVGSSFVIPTVKGHYSNGSEQTLEVTSSNFSGFDSSVEVEGQVITVSYPGVSSIIYTIDIVEEASATLDCTYRIAQSSTTDYKFQFTTAGTGRYYRVYNSTESWTINFTYDYDPSTGAVSIELDHGVTYSQVNNFATGYRLVQANSTSGVISFINDTGFINSSNQLEIDLVRVSAGVFSTEHRVFTLN